MGTQYKITTKPPIFRTDQAEYGKVCHYENFVSAGSRLSIPEPSSWQGFSLSIRPNRIGIRISATRARQHAKRMYPILPVHGLDYKYKGKHEIGQYL